MRHSTALFLLALLPAFFSPAAAAAQEPAASSTFVVLGYVVDRGTGAALPGAAVELPDLNRHVIANSEGRFAVLGIPQGAHRVVVRQLGYEDYHATWNLEREVTTLTIALGAKPIVLEGVTAQGYRFSEQIERRRRSVGVSSRVISRDWLHATGASSARDVVLQMGMLAQAPCPTNRFEAECVRVRGRVVSPRVYIDERPAFGLGELSFYSPRELFAVEIYGGGSHIRAYTSWFVERTGGRTAALQPIFFW